MKRVTHEFNNIEIEVSDGRVTKCVIDGVEGKWTGTGNRRVYQFGKKFVVKFDSATEAWAKKNGWAGRDVKVQNRREIENYKLIAEEDRKYFAAILRTGKVKNRLYVVQEYVPTTRRARKEEREQFNKLRSKYMIGDAAVDCYGKHHHNVAVNKNGFKLFDLGWEKYMPKSPDELKKNEQASLF